MYHTRTLIKYAIKIAKQASLRARGHQHRRRIGDQANKFDLQSMSSEEYNSNKMNEISKKSIESSF